MELTYITSCYINSIILKKYLVKTGNVQKNQQNYLGKKNFSLADHGTFIGQPAYLFYFAPVS